MHAVLRRTDRRVPRRRVCRLACPRQRPRPDRVRPPAGRSVGSCIRAATRHRCGLARTVPRRRRCGAQLRRRDRSGPGGQHPPWPADPRGLGGLATPTGRLPEPGHERHLRPLPASAAPGRGARGGGGRPHAAHPAEPRGREAQPARRHGPRDLPRPRGEPGARRGPLRARDPSVSDRRRPAAGAACRRRRGGWRSLRRLRRVPRGDAARRERRVGDRRAALLGAAPREGAARLRRTGAPRARPRRL